MLVQSPLVSHGIASSTLVDTNSPQNQPSPFSIPGQSPISKLTLLRQSTPPNPPLFDQLRAENFSSPVARRLINQQNQLREKQGENQDVNLMFVADASEDQPFTVYGTPGSMRVATGQIGKGGQGSIYKVKRCFNNRSENSKTEALKVLPHPPATNRLLRGLSRKRLNIPEQQYELMLTEGSTRKEKYCTSLPLGEGDLAAFKFDEVVNPIRTYLSYIKDVAEGAALLHFNDIIHRDIKPQNIIVISQRIGAQLGDLDLAAVVRPFLHFTSCTPGYAPPSIWDNSIDKQARRHGIQTKADDVFALGRTIQYGLIEKIFSLYPETSEQSLNLRPITLQLSDSESAAKTDIESHKSAGKVISILRSKKIPDPSNKKYYRYIPEVIRVFPSRDDLNKTNMQGLAILKGKLDTTEYEALKFSIILANQMQDDSADMRPAMDRVYVNLQKNQRELTRSLLRRAEETEDQNRPTGQRKRARLGDNPGLKRSSTIRPR